MKNYVFDIETIPLPSNQLEALLPAFDPELVKVGNFGPEKAAEKIEKARAEHLNRFMRRAALSAITGQIAMLGIQEENEPAEIIDGQEADIINYFLNLFETNFDKGIHFIGFNIANFDLPFLIRRAWFHGLKVPAGIVRNRYLTSFFTDLLQLWNSSEHANEFGVSLNDLAQFFGCGAKTANGAEFGELLRYEPEKARAYLLNDLDITWKIACRMGAIRGPLLTNEPAEPAPVNYEEPVFNGIKFY
jgi:hypothetical protein